MSYRWVTEEFEVVGCFHHEAPSLPFLLLEMSAWKLLSYVGLEEEKHFDK